VYEYPSRDAKTRALLCSGDAFGILYCESPAMRKALRILQPSSRRELALALALIRPAAASARAVGKAELQERDDVLVFDDDATALLRTELQCSDAEAEVWRKALVKVQRERARARRETGRGDGAGGGGTGAAFEELEACLVARNVSSARVQAVLEAFRHSGSYSFCKSHAMGYAHLCWALAYEKAHRPALFWKEHTRCIGGSGNSVYRPWVYRRAAVLVSVTAATNASGAATRGQRTLSGGPVCALEQYRQQGWWEGAAFLPGCYVRIAHCPPIPRTDKAEEVETEEVEGVDGAGEGEKQARGAGWRCAGEGGVELGEEVLFRGLYACGRRYRGESSGVLFITVGVDNAVFVDCSFALGGGSSGGARCWGGRGDNGDGKGNEGVDGNRPSGERPGGVLRGLDLSKVAFVEGSGQRVRRRGAEWVNCREVILMDSSHRVLHRLSV
jgi:hypothetical protein